MQRIMKNTHDNRNTKGAITLQFPYLGKYYLDSETRKQLRYRPKFQLPSSFILNFHGAPPCRNYATDRD